MKILITGKSGYIARSIHSYLYSKYDITIVGRQDFDLTNSSETLEYFSNKDFDIVIHCAVSGGSRLKPDNWDVLDDNLKMYYNLLNCNNKFKKLIHFGSGAEIYSPETPYGLSKKVISKSITEKENFYNLRIYGVFDENELDTRFIKANIKRYINKESIIIHQDKFMDFFYMKDLVSLVEYYILNTSPPQEINCSYNKKYTLSDITNIINNLDKHSVDIEYNIKGLTDNYNFNGENLLSNLPLLGLEEGIKNVYNILKQQK
jgi:GDP-L-fucose synthase